MTSDERLAILEDEVFILRDSGEIPEIAYHATLHYLSCDPEGPKLELSENERVLLQNAVLERYWEIVLRDIDADNRDLSSYRGIRRTIYNWQRMQDFCSRIHHDCSPFIPRIRSKLLDFLSRELADVSSGQRISSVNCTREMLHGFAEQIELSAESLPDNWQALCLTEE